jgi:hypothetical protein
MKKLRIHSNRRCAKLVGTVSAAALMLGVSHATTVGFNFQSEWQGDTRYTGKIVTAAAFGIPTNGWENLAPLRTGYYGDNGPFATNQVISTSTSSDGLNPLPRGSLQLAWGCTAANVTSFRGYGDPFVNSFTPSPGEEQVYYSFLRDEANIYTSPVGGPIPYRLAITGLLSVWTNTPYVVQLITSSDTASSFANANIGSSVSTQQVTFSSTATSYGNLGGISSVSGPITSDTLHIWSDPATTHSGSIAIAGTIAGFIITDKPVITMSPHGIAAPHDTVHLRALAAGVPPLSYQWRLAGVPIPGATTNSLDIVNITNGGDYDLVVTNLYGSATSKPFTMDRIVVTTDQTNVVVSWKYRDPSLVLLGTQTPLNPGSWVQLTTDSPYTVPVTDAPQYFRYMHQGPNDIIGNPYDQ